MNKSSINQCKLYDDMRIVWLKHVWWTREVILAIAANAPWTQTSVTKLLQNPTEMAETFAPFITPHQQREIANLFTTHLKLGGDIVTAAKNGDTAKVKMLEKQWRQNADQIAHLMASMNINLNESEVRRMMYEHLQLTTDEAVQTLQGKYDQSAQTFDQIQNQALMMADYFSTGIRSTL